jgi:hypothetical protein
MVRRGSRSFPASYLDPGSRMGEVVFLLVGVLLVAVAIPLGG